MRSGILHAEVLKTFPEISDQFEYRKETILNEVEKTGHTLEGVAAFVGRGGGLVSLEGGTYDVNATLLAHARVGFTVKHPATLGRSWPMPLQRSMAGRRLWSIPPMWTS